MSDASSGAADMAETVRELNDFCAIAQPTSFSRSSTDVQSLS